MTGKDHQEEAPAKRRGDRQASVAASPEWPPPGGSILGSPPSAAMVKRQRREEEHYAAIWRAADLWLASYKHGEIDLLRMLDEVQFLATGKAPQFRRTLLGWAAEQAIACPTPKRRKGKQPTPAWHVALIVFLIDAARERGLRATDSLKDPQEAVAEAMRVLDVRRVNHEKTPEQVLSTYQKWCAHWRLIFQRDPELVAWLESDYGSVMAD